MITRRRKFLFLFHQVFSHIIRTITIFKAILVYAFVTLLKLLEDWKEALDSMLLQRKKKKSDNGWCNFLTNWSFLDMNDTTIVSICFYGNVNFKMIFSVFKR